MFWSKAVARVTPFPQHRVALIALLLFHSGLLGWIAAKNAPVLDEVAHLPAGLRAIRFGHCDLYAVNPPLVKVLAAIPASLDDVDVTCLQWNHERENGRPEWDVGRAFARANPDKFIAWIRLGRWTCIPFSLLGAIVCFQWSRELYGSAAGWIALVLWCFSPTVLAWGSTITPDVAAAALAAASAYLFRNWILRPTWLRAVASGGVLGLAELSKVTALVLFAIWPFLWLLSRAQARGDTEERPSVLQLLAILFTAIVVLNVGYGFHGSFQKLKDFDFHSDFLKGSASAGARTSTGNRFRAGLAGELRVPFPEDFVRGIDLQKRDFEEPQWGYFAGRWSLGGPWYYYAYALCLKEPLGTLALLIVGLVTMAVGGREYRASCMDECILLIPLLVIFALASSQAAFIHHLRYLLPIFPFAFIWLSRVGVSFRKGDTRLQVAAILAITASVASSLWAFPHCISYFNELGGGPASGHRYLIDANVDWGQDILRLRDWCDHNPQARPLHIACVTLLEPRDFGLEYADLSHTSEAQKFVPTDSFAEGWYALSIHELHDRHGKFDYFMGERPVQTIGYSIYVYRVSADR